MSRRTTTPPRGKATPPHPQHGGKGLSGPVSGAQSSSAPLPMPHERDQSLDQVERQPDPRIEQARADLAAGQVDTDMRAKPGLDAQRRASIVSTPLPERGADAPRRDTAPSDKRALASKPRRPAA
jgi:hypothetical protein